MKEKSRSISLRDFSIFIGNALDHFDTSLYGFLAPLLGPVFFPSSDPVVQLLLAYSLLGTSLLTRPLGSFLFGRMALYQGPLVGLSYSLIGVALTTMAMGFLPGYKQVGWVAPTGLILARFIRGIFSAGESTIAKLYILEGKEGAEGFKASYLYQMSSMVGIVLASGVSTLSFIFSENDLGWRCCFWAGGVTALVGCALRSSFLKSSLQVCDERKVKKPFSFYQVSSLRTVWRQRQAVGEVALCTAFSHLTYTIPFVFMNSFVPLITSLSLQRMMELNTLFLVLDMGLVPVLGHFLRKFEPKKIMLTASSILGITIIPLFLGLSQASWLYVSFVRGWIVLWGVVFLCPLNMWYKKRVKTADQYLVIGMGGALGSATVGRLTPSICLGLWYGTGTLWGPSFYLAAIMALTSYVVGKNGEGNP